MSEGTEVCFEINQFVYGCYPFFIWSRFVYLFIYRPVCYAFSFLFFFLELIDLHFRSVCLLFYLFLSCFRTWRLWALFNFLLLVCILWMGKYINLFKLSTATDMWDLSHRKWNCESEESGKGLCQSVCRLLFLFLLTFHMTTWPRS